MKRASQIQIAKKLSWTEKQLPQKERTKHVHSIHQYTGKFIPQLVDYFLERDLKKSKIILDPFVGSGTTLVQANIHGIPSFGIDVSKFNVLLSNAKIQQYNIPLLKKEINEVIIKTIKINEKKKKNLKIDSEYLNKWYSKEALNSLLIFRNLIDNYHYSNILKIILSRAARSSRMAPHHELNFPNKPASKEYYCYKHSRICKPTTNSLMFLKKYCKDVLNRLIEFDGLRNDVYTKTFFRDSRKFDFSEYSQKIDGVITSPPYVGFMNYHEQHRYSYELLGIKDNSDKEIGPKNKGVSKKAILDYMSDITKIFKNIVDNALDCKNGKIVIVVEDKLDIYEEIIDNADLEISKRVRRSVNRRTGRPDIKFFEDILICNPKKR